MSLSTPVRVDVEDSPGGSPTGALGYLGELAAMLLRIEATGFEGEQLPFEEAAQHGVTMLKATQQLGRKVMIIGNGGSAAIASHLHNDLFKAAGMRALVFQDPALATAYANDESYAAALQNMSARWADEGDLLVAVSSSGRSANILNAVKACLQRGVNVITLSGFAPDNPLRRLGHINFYAPAQSYGMVEMTHACLSHYLSDAAAGLVSHVP